MSNDPSSFSNAKLNTMFQTPKKTHNSLFLTDVRFQDEHPFEIKKIRINSQVYKIPVVLSV
jgi:hypothetical protein